MRKKADPLGRLLVRSGALDERSLAEALAMQARGMPIASLCYILGMASEDALVRALSRHWGVPGIVLGRSVVHTAALRGVSRELALRHGVLPVVEDDSRVYVAITNPEDTTAEREIGFLKGKTVVSHVALNVAVERATRRAYAAAARGETHVPGEDARPGIGPGSMWVVLDVDEMPGDITRDSTIETEPDEITRELYDGDLLRGAGDDSPDPDGPDTAGQGPETGTGPDTLPSQGGAVVMRTGPDLAPSGDIDLDGGGAATPVPGSPPRGTPRVVVVDDDFATRQLVVKMLAAEGYQVEGAATGKEAIQRLRRDVPDLVVMDVMLPDVDGFRICRAIKSSRKYAHVAIVLMSAVIDSGRVTAEVLAHHGADAYFEKPLHEDRLRRKVAELLGARAAHSPSGDDGTFQRSLDLYRDGKLDDAIAMLHQGLAHDPLSTRHHFVLANLLQKKNLVFEAIDEYEATVQLKPDYFPALSRLAYLYYKKGYATKAIETWRRSLPYCPDPTLRQNIELFMRKVIADIQSGG